MNWTNSITVFTVERGGSINRAGCTDSRCAPCQLRRTVVGQPHWLTVLVIAHVLRLDNEIFELMDAGLVAIRNGKDLHVAE